MQSVESDKLLPAGKKHRKMLRFPPWLVFPQVRRIQPALLLRGFETQASPLTCLGLSFPVCKLEIMILPSG